MNFTCEHCGKIITCSARLIDGNFLHSTCVDEFNEIQNSIDELLNENEVTTK